MVKFGSNFKCDKMISLYIFVIYVFIKICSFHENTGCPFGEQLALI